MDVAECVWLAVAGLVQLRVRVAGAGKRLSSQQSYRSQQVAVASQRACPEE